MRGLPFAATPEDIVYWFNSAGLPIQPLTSERSASVMPHHISITISICPLIKSAILGYQCVTTACVLSAMMAECNAFEGFFLLSIYAMPADKNQSLLPTMACQPMGSVDIAGYTLSSPAVASPQEMALSGLLQLRNQKLQWPKIARRWGADTLSYSLAIKKKLQTLCDLATHSVMQVFVNMSSILVYSTCVECIIASINCVFAHAAHATYRCRVST